MLCSVTLSNFKSHDKTTVEFKPGVNAICGANYAGKTTILQAVGLTVYGFASENLGDYVRDGENHADVSVRLESAHDGRVYAVECSLAKNQKTGNATAHRRVMDVERGVALATGADDTFAFVRQHLRAAPGTDLKSLFEHAVGVPQGEITTAFTQTEAKRRQEFDALLRVDEFRSTWNAMLSAVNHVETRIGELKVEIAGLEGSTRELEAVEAAAQRLDRQVADGEKAVARLSAEAKRLDAENAGWKTIEMACGDARSTRDQAETALRLAGQAMTTAKKEYDNAATAAVERDTHRPAYDAYDQAESTLKTLDKQRSQREKIQTERATIASHLATLTERAKQAERSHSESRDAAERRKSLVPLIAREEQRKKALHAATELVNRIVAEVGVARKAQAESKDGLCPLLKEACRNVAEKRNAGVGTVALNVFFGDEAARLAGELIDAKCAQNEAQAALDALQDGDKLLPSVRDTALAILAVTLTERGTTLKRATDARDEQQGKVDGLDRELMAFANLDADIAVQENIRDANKAGRDAYVRLSGLAEKVTERKNTLDEATKAEATRKAELGMAEAEFQEALAAYDKEAHGKVKTAFTDAKVNHAAAETALGKDREGLATAQRKLRALRADRIMLRWARGERERLEQLKGLIVTVRQKVRDAGPKVTQLLVAAVERAADRLFADMIGDGASGLRWTDSYEVRLVQAGVERGLGTAAGSEKVLASLAVRLALMESLGEVRFAFLDEPTIHLDEQRRGALVDQLTAANRFDQLVVISHDDAFKAAVGHAIVLEKNAEQNRSHVDYGLGTAAATGASL